MSSQKWDIEQDNIKSMTFSDIKDRCMYIDSSKTVVEDRSSLLRNTIFVSKGFLYQTIHSYSSVAYPLSLGISEFLFYLPNFIRMKVHMKPGDFNGTVVESIMSFIDCYTGKSRIILHDIPKARLLYKGVASASIPYTSLNWSLRISVYKNLHNL